MEIKGKHIYGLGAAVVGAIALLYALLYWFINRTLDTNVQVGFALGLVGLALFAWLEIDWLTRVLKTRQVRFGAERLALAILFLIVVGMLNWILTRDRLPITPQFAIPLQGRADLTEDRQHTLTPESTNMLQGLTAPVRVLAFYSETSAGKDDTDTLLRSYKEKSNGMLDYEFVDPFTKPALVEEYGITREGALVVLRDDVDRRESVEFADESSLTNAIVRLNDPTVLTVYFITGHGETGVEDTGQEGLSQVKSLLEGVNYQVKTLNAVGETIPADASALVIAGPSLPYSDAEVQSIDTYLDGGGKLVVLYEPSPLAGVEPGADDPLVRYLGENWALTLNDDFIVDTSAFYQTPEFPATINYGTTSISKELENVNSIFLLARSIALSTPDGVAPEGLTLAPIVSTMPGTAWAETNVAALSDPTQTVEQDETEATGELVIGATAESSVSGGRVVVFGDSDFGQNQFWQGNVGNGFLLLNSIKWVTAREDQIALTPRENTVRSMTINDNRDVAIIFLLACLLPPLVVVIGGLAVWWARRSG